MTQVYPAYRGLRFEEDHALELMLAGLTVPNAQGKALPVKVIWKDPLREMNQVTYPYFLLEFLDIAPRRNEEVRGVVPYYYQPYTGNLVGNSGEYVLGEFAVPIMMYYQATVYSSNQQHDVILNDMCATTFFPIRYGQIACPSGTNRRLDFMSVVNRDSLDNNGRRIYAKVWTFAISGEIVPLQWNSNGAEVTQFDLTVEETGSHETDPTIVIT